MSPFRREKRRARDRRGAVACLLFAALVLAPAAAGAQAVDYFVIQYPSISPNGDGVRDASLVRAGLTKACDRLLVVLETVSASPIDTLIDVAGPDSGTVHEHLFDGTDGAGAPLAEGTYRLRCAALGAGPVEEYVRPVIVDITAPLVRVERIEPGIYAPEVPGTAQTVLIYYSLQRTGPGDTLSMVVTNPLGEGERTTIAAPGDGEHDLEFSADNDAPDGIYSISIVCADEAGNSSGDAGSLDVDTQGPTQSFVVTPPSHTSVPPPVITGKAYDRNGFHGFSLTWDGGSPFPPDSSWADGDTLRWRFDAIDSLRAGSGYREGSHTITARCSDPFGVDTVKHRTKIQYTFTLDLTAPDAPVLEQPASPSREPRTVLRGTVSYPGASFVRVTRLAGPFADTVTYEPSGTTFAVIVPLLEGDNVISATAEDDAGNVSGLSNTVTVRYEPGNEVVWPEALRGPDAFRVYTASPALRTTVDIYTVAGELVATLVENGPSQAFILDWDLTNDDGEDVRNGPYLAVITVTHENRTRVYKAFVAVVR